MEDPRASLGTVACSASVEFRVLGPVQALQEGTPLPLGGPKQRTVLALLIAARGKPVSTDALLANLYGEDATPKARRTLQTFVSNLRNVVGERLTRVGDGYLLEADQVDAEDFETLYRQSREEMETETSRAAETLRQALEMWFGHAYSDVEMRATLSVETSRLGEMRLNALESRIEADLALGLHADLVGELEALAEEYPLRETIRSHHMLALYRSGRQGEAVRAFGRTRTLLAEEMGIDPSPELQALEEAILTQDPGLEIKIDRRVEKAAILVAELVGTTVGSLAERDQDLAERDRFVNRVAERSGGRVVGVRGLATVVRFPDVESSLDSAAEFSRRSFRVAIDQGELEVGEADTTGPPVVRSLRLAAIAHPGQILLSTEANSALADATTGGWSIRSLGRHRVPGLDDDLPIHQLLTGDSSAEFPPLNLDRLPPITFVGTRAIAGYELREHLGGGGAIAIRRAYQRSIGREVVVRIIGSEISSDPVFIRRFGSEAQRIANTEHPHLAPLLDYWRVPDAAYLVTRRFGRSLANTSLREVDSKPLDVVLTVGAGRSPRTARRWRWDSATGGTRSTRTWSRRGL